MKKLYCKRKYSISLIIVFSLFIQLFVPFFSIVANAVSSDEQIRNENGVILVDRNNTYEETEFYKDSLFGIAGGFHLVGLDTVEPAEEEIISDESDEEKIVTEEEVEEEPVAKVVQVEARNSGSGFSSLTPIYNESTGEFEIRFQYDLEKVQPGDEFTVDIDSTYIDLEELQDGVNYTVIKDGSTYKIKFKDEFSGANQGIISIKTQTKEVDKSDEYKIEWKLDAENFFKTIFIKKPGDSESDIRGEKSSKNVQSYIWDITNKIEGVNEDGKQFITVKDEITSVDIPYTLVYETTTGGNLNIKDELDDLLTYNKGSFIATLETWDETGWNKTTTTVDLASYLNISGNSFTISDYDQPANSRITINYNANVKDAKALETHLNQLLEEKKLDGKEGSVSYVFTNKAKINDEDRDGNYSGNVNVPSKKPEVKPEYPSNVLEKYVDPTTANATFDNEGKLIPIPVTYTLKLNMSKFNGDNIKQLTDNLILTDNLDPNHKVEFELSDVTIISDGGVTVQKGDVDETDKTIGNYSIENKQFKFNAGKEPADYTIILKGNITALNNQKDYWSPLPFFDYYSYKNTAVAEAGDFKDTREATTTVIDRKGQTTITDSNVFNKGHKTNPTTPVIGKPIEVTYTFTVNDHNAGTNAVDVSKSTITDVLDPIFDTSKGYEITLSDNWNGQSLDYITHSLKDGELTIDFADNMPENIKKARWVINITLTTFPITEQSQALIRNSASLTGSDSGMDYSSSTETSGQTTGGELLVRKTVTDLDNINYRKNYTLELDSDGNPKHKEFNYKIDLIPQVDYRNVKIIPLTDVLPEALEFVGLIGSWESDTATVSRTTQEYENNSGKVEVKYEDGKVFIKNDNSQFGSGPISIRFRVKLKEDVTLNAGQVISNVITSQDPPANITIVEPGKYPINITKVDSDTGERIIDENQVARFKLEKVEEGGNTSTVYNDIRILLGQLVDAEGKALIVDSTGNYILTETKAPTGYILSEEPISIRVTENGTIPGQIEVQNTPGVDPEPETTEISVEKKWIGTEGENITVNLLANEEKIKDVVLSSANNWKHTFTDLPTVNDVTGEAINYTVEEVEIEGYESSIAGSADLGFVITNTEKTSVDVEKKWIGTEGENITVNLLANEEKIKDVVLSSANNWKHTFTDLPTVNDVTGEAINYTVEEVEIEGYESSIAGSADLGFVITNTEKTPIEPEKTSVDVEKKWIGTEGENITVNLLANEEKIKDVVLSSANNWKHTFTDLPTVNDVTGEAINYTVEEVEIEGYESSIAGSADLGFVITNTEKTSVDVEKKWIGTEGENITVNLLANEEKIKDVVLSSANNWKHTFTDLPTVNDVTGEAINYTVEEVEIEGYESSIAGSADLGFVITNTEKTSVDVEKKWIGTEGENITVNLLANEEKIKDVVLSSANNWKHTFTDLPTVNDVTGEAINYTVEEVEIEGYESSIAGSADLGFVITNTEKTSVDVEKKWIGTEGENITVNLLANEEKIKDVVLSSANNWKHTFTDLPTVNDVTGEAINYTVEEVEIEGYESSIAGSADLGFVITNTEKTPIEPEKTKVTVSVTKAWKDNNNQDGKRPDAITIKLLADGEDTGKTLVLTATNNWTDSFTDLDEYKAGTKIVYTIEELTLGSGYTSVITGDAATGFEVTNTKTPEVVDVSGTKTWEDNNDQDGMRPESITIRLLKNGTEIASKTVTEADGWAWSFTDLPKYEAGELITYTITEDTVSEYSSAVSGYNVTNTHTPGKTSVQVTKAWADGNNQDGVRPESVTIKLLADGVDTGKTLVLTATNNWTDTFTDLDEYKAGQKIVYTIEELTLGSGYTSVITGDAATGFEVTNTKTPEVVDVSGTKTWEDNNDQDGMRPESITIRLLKNGTEIASKTVTEADGWAWSFTDLPKYEAGELITYTITEDTVSEYSSAVSGYNVTNTHTPGKTSVQVTKAWADGNNQDGVRPESVTIKLLADGVDTGKTLVLTATNNWTDTFTDLDEYKAGTKIVYTIEELTLGSGYTSVITGDAATGFEVTNTKTPEVVDVSGTKTWEDNNDQDGMRPESITIRLLKNGTEIASKTVTEADGWAWSFTDLPKYEAGELITYTITEDTVSEYSSAVSGYNVTNTHTPGKTSVQVTKAWADGNNQDGVRPESVTIKLLADGVDTGKTLVLTATNNWTDTFTDLDEYKAGQKIVYTIEELTLGSGYTSVITGDAATGFEVTNTKTPEVVDVSGTKTWEDNNDQDGMRPESITIRLLKNGTEIASKTVTEADGWAWSFTDLPKYEAGELITYTITEDTVSEYSSAVSGYNVTNTHTPGKTSVQVTKAWADGNNQDGVRPESVTIKLLADGVDTGKTLVLTATNNWTDTFTDLDEYKAGTKIVYTIEELTLGSGYTSVITGDAATGFEVTNTKTPEVVDVSGTKTWEDNNDQDGMRPESITIRLLKNGTEIASKTVTEADGWAWSFTDLPKYEAGELITYTITEDTVSEYSSAVSGYNVTNTHTPGKTSVQVTKAWADGNNQDGVRPESVTIKLLADGVDTGKTLVLTATNNWTDTFTDLDEYKAGTKIVYTIEEVAVGNGYTSAVTGNAETGFTVTNSYTPPTEPTEPTTPTEPTEPTTPTEPTEPTTPTEPTKPTTPTEPTKPTTPTEPTKPTGPTELPKTGEDSGPYLWLSLMCMSVGALLLLFRRKTKIQND